MAGNNSVDASAVLTWHNEFRASHSLGPLTWSSSLVLNATNWADRSASFPSCWTPTAIDQYDLEKIAYTTAWGSTSNTTVSSLFKTWTNEPPTNITSNNATAILAVTASNVGCAIGQNSAASCFAFVCVYQHKATETSPYQKPSTFVDSPPFSISTAEFVVKDSPALLPTVVSPPVTANAFASNPSYTTVLATSQRNDDPYTDFGMLAAETNDVRASTISPTSSAATTSTKVSHITTASSIKPNFTEDDFSIPVLLEPKLRVTYEDGKLIVSANLTSAKSITSLQVSAFDTKLNETVLQTENRTVTQDHRREAVDGWTTLAFDMFNFRTPLSYFKSLQ
ncbi:hypothetical protein HDU99_000228 [Rhizoclosmatium hyalinum]|nr:hypothetical protein HDU99_000228 [Rhizoclosmatium hyalinum]